MTLSAGTRLGPYEVVAPIGRGGMGEVYRARDTRLDRTVAIKVVGDAWSPFDIDATLEREARAAATLNHPHICALHDVCHESGTPFLVMEHVNGETLAARLARGPVPLRDAIRIAIQIGEALDHAHRNGVVHRDLKPANIMLTQAGVKVLDFGLATLRRSATVPLPLDRTPVVSSPLTEPSLLGTVYYMAPERLEGGGGDAASDLFALGVVVYEMVTGTRPFDADDAAGVIASILRADPPLPSMLAPDVPPALDWLIQKALAKQPSARWRAAGDIVEILRWLASAPSTPSGRTPNASPPASRRITTRWPLFAGFAALAAIASLAALAPRFSAAPAAPSLTFSIGPPDGGAFTPTPSSVQTQQFAISPDGRRLVFVASVGRDAPQLWIRPLDSLTPEPLAGTHDAEYPFWSPDSESIAFFAVGQLKRVDFSGGPSRVIAPAKDGRGGAWTRHGDILFAPSTNDGIYRVPATGGTPVAVTHVDSPHHEASHRWPQLLPDDEHFLYFVHTTSPDPHGIYVGDVHGTESRRLLTSALSAAFVAPDRLLFVSDDALMTQRFDWKQQRLVGDATPIVAPIAGSSNFSAAVSASHTGLLAYSSGIASAEIAWIDRAGHRLGSVGAPGDYVDFRLSPDARQLALAEVNAQSHRPDLRVLDLTRGANLRLTTDPATDASPVWSPDGTQIIYRSNPNGVHDLYEKPANGSAPQKLLLKGPNAKYPTDWTPDGRSVVYHAYDGDTGADIWMADVDGSHVHPLVKTPFDELQGQVSRDGRWLAYTSLESGSPEVYVSSMMDADTRWQVSAGGGSDPRWRGGGRELFYISADSWLTVVAFDGRRPATPRRLFQVRVSPAANPYLSNYDVTADGQRFLVKAPVHDVTSAPIRVVTNWTSARTSR